MKEEKEKFLAGVKNAMFWHFTFQEIKDTLEDLNACFDQASKEGRKDEEIIKEYGSPGMFAKELLKESYPGGIGKKLHVIIKNTLLAVLTLVLLVPFVFLPPFEASCILAVLSPVIIWLLAGNNCLLTVIKVNKNKRETFIKSQAAVFLFFVLLQLFTYVIVPKMAENGYTIYIGRFINIIIYPVVVILFILEILFLKKMLSGNIYMFFAATQNLSIISSLFLYASFLKNIETLENIRFIFIPYLISLPVTFIYYIYIVTKERRANIGCTD